MNNAYKDFSARRAAVTVTDKNIVVEAGAGTGKTTLLINRLCFLILSRGISVERIVALTFTEKAASEIKLRLASALQKVLSDTGEPPDEIQKILLETVSKEEIVKRARAALERLDRAFISTIHSFCSYILKAYPVEAGISPSAAVDEGEHGARLFKRLWHKWLESELAENSPSESAWEEVLKEISLEDIYNYAFDLCGGKVEGYNPFSHKEFLSEVCFENAAVAEQMASAFMPAGKSRKIERSLASAAVILQEVAFGLKEGGIVPSDNPEPESVTSSDQAKGWDDENFETADRIIEFARSLYPSRQILISKVYNLIKDFTAQVREAYAAQGLVSFDDLLVKTRNLLRDNTTVRAALKAQFEILFIDEFQDTDPVQGELLLYLAEDAASAKNWKDIKLKPGRLFVVGDPKQSIYRFRGADITAYHLFTDLILKQGGIQCFLQTNFRSAGGIIDFVNAVGEGVIKERTGFQPVYVPIYVSSAKSSLPESVEEVIIKSGEKQSADDYRHNQAEYAARWISENAGKLKLANGKILDYKDICILMRTSSAFNIFTSALKRRGVKYTVEEDKNFFTAQEIVDFINLLSFLENPSDKTALAGVLRGPLGAFTDNEIYDIFKQNRTNIFDKNTGGRLGAFYKTLSSYAGLVGRITLNELVHKILRETLFIEAAQKAYNGEQTVSNINKFTATVARETAQNPLSLGQLLINLKEKSLLNRGEGESPLADEFLSAVSVMTVHKSKGLEFPVVFLADIFRLETNKSNNHAYSWFHNMHGLRAGNFADANLAFLEVQSLWHGKSEEARILYVALTRAREKLIILGNDAPAQKTAARHLINCGVWPVEETAPKLPVKVNVAAYQPPENFIYAAGKEVLREEEIKTAAWAARWAARGKTYETLRGDKIFTAPSSLAGEEVFSRSAALTGDLCHKVLELWDFKSAVTPQDIFAAAPQIETTPSEENIKEAEVILNNFNSSALFKTLTAAEILAREMPFTLMDGDKIISGVMDLIIKDGAGICVLDYKTDKNLEPRRYKEQLDAYVRAAKEIFKTQNVKSGIISLRDARLLYNI